MVAGHPNVANETSLRHVLDRRRKDPGALQPVQVMKVRGNEKDVVAPAEVWTVHNH
jgi:hypothetical protein